MSIFLFFAEKYKWTPNQVLNIPYRILCGFLHEMEKQDSGKKDGKIAKNSEVELDESKVPDSNHQYVKPEKNTGNMIGGQDFVEQLLMS